MSPSNGDNTIVTMTSQGNSDAIFDPMRDLFVAQLEKPTQLREVNLRVLSPFQRALLVFDGSVTKLIEAYTMEPVEVIRISQAIQQLASDNSWLQVSEGTKVLARQVILRGTYSHRTHVYAVSLLVHERLPDHIKVRLGKEGPGLGRMMIDSRMETFREILWYGMERLSNLPEKVGYLADEEFLSRTYRIIVNKEPIMLINERFPVGSDRLPSHH